MLVSVIIPSFRQPQFLARAIESCLEQDHADLEVIVVEDNSRDASLAIAASLARRDNRVRVFDLLSKVAFDRSQDRSDSFGRQWDTE
jgi:glycosyltransferase involved in cell wall biosynthesis